MFLVILVNVLYALVCPLGKIALYYAYPIFLTAYRMIISGIFVLGYQYAYRRHKFTVSKKEIWPLALGAIFSIYITNWLEFSGLDDLSPAKTAFLYNLYPFASALLSYLYLGEKLGFKKLIGLIIGFLGSLPLLLVNTVGDSPAYKYMGLISLPEISVIAAVFACPFGWIFIQKAVCDDKLDSVMANGITMLAGGIMALVHSFIVEPWTPFPITDYPYFLLTSFTLMLVSNILANTLYIELLKTYSLTLLSFSAFMTPLLTACFDKVLFGYPIALVFYLSTIIMFLGFYLFYKEC